MKNTIYRVNIPIIFKEGLSAGAGKKANRSIVALNGRGKPVLHGSTIAGVLRSAYNSQASSDVNYWFGEALNNDGFHGYSKIKIMDVELDTGSISSPISRTHNAINRHTGVAIKGGLFSIEYLPPGTTGEIILEIEDQGNQTQDVIKFIEVLASLFKSTLFFGGNRNRGVGRASAEKGLHFEKFDLSITNDYANFLDAKYKGNAYQSNSATSKKIEGSKSSEHFEIKLILGIPQGEDILAGDGQTLDYILEPQTTTAADGKEYWRIAGSSLRGVIRAWVTRLAARSGKHICDNAQNFIDNSQNLKGDELGWGFVDKKSRKNFQKEPEALNDPILDLFGSLYGKGRIHIADCISRKPKSSNDQEERMHISVDRFSGGTNEGALFQNMVLKAKEIEFPLEIKIEYANEEEIAWLCATLKAIHLGLISVGSSRSAGRLKIKSFSECNKENIATDLKNFLKGHEYE